MFRVEQDLSNLFADSGIAGVAKGLHFYVIAFEPIGQQFDLCAFAAAVRAVNDDEFAREFII
jgi:hypothetical protein